MAETDSFWRPYVAVTLRFFTQLIDRSTKQMTRLRRVLLATRVAFVSCAIAACAESPEDRQLREVREQVDALMRKASADSAARAAAFARPTGSWRPSETTDAMDGAKNVTIALDADSAIMKFSAPIKPTLMIRCRKNETDLYVVNGVSADVEYGLSDQATVRLRVDSAAAFEQVWTESTSGETLFAQNPIALARRLHGAKTLIYRFTPFRESAQTTTFTLHGIREVLPKVAAACGWKI